MGCFGKSLAGAGYVVLNVIRVLNIISLLAVIAASTVMLVKTFVVSKFYFFDATAHVIEVVISVFLILTELPLFKAYFAKNWPLYSPKHGFVMLGVTMILLGNNLLGNLNKLATSQKVLGLSFWRLVIGAGIVVLVMGMINIIASYIFRDTKIHMTARQVRSNGAVAAHKVDVESTIEAQSPAHNTKHRRSFFLGRRDTLPSYYSRSTNGGSLKGSPQSAARLNLLNNISSPISDDKYHLSNGSSPQSIQQPNLAHHPAMTTGHMI